MAVSILEQHASEAAFLWMLRDGAAGDPHYDLAELAGLDERVEANLDGLRIAGEDAWPICLGGLKVEEAGEFFVASVVATDRGDLRGIATILDAGGDDPALQRGIVGGLAWLPFEITSRIVPGLLDPACPSPLHLLGISACAAHRRDPGPALDQAIYSDDLRLRARALLAAGELGRHNLARQMLQELGSEDEACRFGAAWSAALLGERDALPALWAIAERGGKLAAEACAVALRCADVRTAGSWVRALASRPETYRLAVRGAGIVGDPEIVPWLLECMASPEHARAAGESLAMITGVDLVRERLRGRPPQGFKPGPTEDPEDDDVEMDPDENLPWPEPDAVKRWWSKNRGHLSARSRHLLGKPITPAWCEHVLRAGAQRQRAAAAIELALASPGKPLFAVRAPAPRQRELLG